MPAKAASKKSSSASRKKAAKPKIAAKAAKTAAVKKVAAAPQEIPETQAPLSASMKQHLEAFVHDIAGKDGLNIIESIGDAGVTDEIIEQKTELKIAEVRCILNHLHSYGVVEYKREKNMDNGWFTYTWSVNRQRALQNYLQVKKREYDDLRRKVAYAENSSVYRCRKGCATYEFDSAMENQFRCPKCKGNLKYENNTEYLKKITERVKSMEGLLNDFQLGTAPAQQPAVMLETQKRS